MADGRCQISDWIKHVILSAAKDVGYKHSSKRHPDEGGVSHLQQLCKRLNNSQTPPAKTFGTFRNFLKVDSQIETCNFHDSHHYSLLPKAKDWRPERIQANNCICANILM